MLTKEHGNVRRLRDRFDTGFAGFGYGGDNLYVVCIVDSFDPPRYMVRADSFEDAYYVAQECLSETVEDSPYFAQDYGVTFAEMVASTGNLPDGLTITESGRLVSTDDDIRVTHYKGVK